MEIIKILKAEAIECGCHELELDDDFFNHSHGLNGECTLCSIANEEWNYDKYVPVKKITCPNCLEIIKLCREYTFKI